MTGSPARFVAAAERAADAAGQVLRRYFRRGLDAQLKHDHSPVTEADLLAERAMRAVLEEEWAGHAILGEETGLGETGLGETGLGETGLGETGLGETGLGETGLGEMGLGDGGASHCWVLDPIDGTRAFLTGRPSFATLIALLIDGAPVLGVIDQPITGERWIGCAGLPTTFTGGLGSIGTRTGRGLAACELSCTSPAMFSPAEAARWQSLAGAAGRASYGGDGYAYGLLALGQIDIVAEAGMKLWDWAALVPVVHGAGGAITDWSGAAMRSEGCGQVLAVADPALLGAAVRALAGDQETS